MDTPVANILPAESDTLPPNPTDHPLYHEIDTFIEQGDWQAALEPLTQLLALYPNDGYLQEVAASVRARSALLGDASERSIAPAANSFLTLGLKFLIPSLLVIVGLCAVAGLFLAVRSWVLPQAASQQQEVQISQLRDEAQNALASGDYDRAVVAYNKLLQTLPDDPQALSGLEQASQLRTIISLYSEAIAAMEAHHWENALALFQQIEAEQPGYRDVSKRIEFVQEQQTLVDRFNEAEAAFDQGNYELAIQHYETLQSGNSSFQSDIVQNHLFLSYLQAALAEENAAGNNPRQLQSALEKFEKALALRPDDSQAKGESQLIKSYLAGLDAFNDRSWSQVITDLTPVYETRPDFADGAVSQYLYKAYVAWGDDLLTDEQSEEAMAKYEEARSIKGADTSGLAQKVTLAEAMLATPTPEPTPTTPHVASARGNSAPAPTPTPTPETFPYTLKGMSVRNNCSGSGYIHGVIWNAYNLPLAGVTVHAFNTTTGVGPLISNPTNADGIYQIMLNGDQIDGLWMVQILEGGQLASQTWGQHLGGGCVNGAQELKVDWQRALVIE